MRRIPTSPSTTLLSTDARSAPPRSAPSRLRNLALALTCSATSVLAPCVLATPNAHSGHVQVAVSLQKDEASGVVVTPGGRMFLTLPRAGVNHTDPSLVEIINGQPVAFPDTAHTVPSGKPLAEWLVSPLGLTLSGNTLWVLDEGKRAGIDAIPADSAKLVAIDIPSRQVVKTILINKPQLRDTQQLNDLRVDVHHGAQGTVYISNNGFSKPDSSLLVVDIASGSVRELFRDQPQVSPAPGYMTWVEGKPHAYSVDHPTMPQGGVNGIELSPDGKTLYWTIPTNANTYSLPTALLSDPKQTEADLAKAIHFEGQAASNGGITVDDHGTLYYGDAAHHAIVAKNTQGQFSLVAQDPRLIWPDGLYYRKGYLYVSVGQWQRAPGLNGGKDLRKAPYEVLKIKVGG